jgi:hypothetical protein
MRALHARRQASRRAGDRGELAVVSSTRDDLVGRTTRGIFRDLMTGSTVGAIETAFQDEGFAPNPDCHYQQGPGVVPVWGEVSGFDVCGVAC